MQAVCLDMQDPANESPSSTRQSVITWWMLPKMTELVRSLRAKPESIHWTDRCLGIMNVLCRNQDDNDAYGTILFRQHGKPTEVLDVILLISPISLWGKKTELQNWEPIHKIIHLKCQGVQTLLSYTSSSNFLAIQAHTKTAYRKLILGLRYAGGRSYRGLLMAWHHYYLP